MIVRKHAVEGLTSLLEALVPGAGASVSLFGSGGIGRLLDTPWLHHVARQSWRPTLSQHVEGGAGGGRKAVRPVPTCAASRGGDPPGSAPPPSTACSSCPPRLAHLGRGRGWLQSYDPSSCWVAAS